NPDGITAETRENARGVDINRDFPASNADGASHPTEPETRALVDLVEAADPAAILSIHCCEPLFDWDGPARPLAETMAAAMADEVRFPVERLGAPPGSLGSWAGRNRGHPVVTVEFDCHGPTDIRRQLDEVEASVDAAFAHLADERNDTDDPTAPRDPPDSAGTSAGGHPIRVDTPGGDSPPALLIVGGLADNRLRGRTVAEYLRRTLFARLDGPSPVAALTAANPDGLAPRSLTNSDGVSVPDDFTGAHDHTSEARTVAETVERLGPRLIVSVETDDRLDCAATLGASPPETDLTIDRAHLSPVTRRFADLGPPVLRLGVHHRPALGRGADDVPDPERYVRAVLDAERLGTIDR
ncbi:MAG: hypothetical protein ABEN55_13305, partial [Bradymonadaceae bacterium]